jgi:hypothetical protein
MRTWTQPGVAKRRCLGGGPSSSGSPRKVGEDGNIRQTSSIPCKPGHAAGGRYTSVLDFECLVATVNLWAPLRQLWVRPCGALPTVRAGGCSPARCQRGPRRVQAPHPRAVAECIIPYLAIRKPPHKKKHKKTPDPGNPKINVMKHVCCFSKFQRKCAFAPPLPDPPSYNRQFLGLHFVVCLFVCLFVRLCVSINHPA